MDNKENIPEKGTGNICPVHNKEYVYVCAVSEWHCV